jgi:hypothetical protein
MLLYMLAACALWCPGAVFIFLQVQCVFYSLQLNADGGEVWMVFLVSGFVLSLLGRAQLCFVFLFGRWGERVGFFFLWSKVDFVV